MAGIDINLNQLISSYSYNSYRNYRVISKNQREEFLYKKIIELSKRKDVWIIEDGDGLVVLEKLLWDTAHFGVGMAKIEYMITKRDLKYKEDLKIKDKLIKKALEVAKRNKIKHITARIDCADNAGAYALERNGFYLMDTILTYIFIQNNKIPDLKELYKVREAKEKDLPTLMDIARKSFRNSRFHRDPYLPNDRADELYAEWVKNAYYEKEGFVLVAENNNKKSVGFFTCRMNQDLLRYCKIKCLGRGLAACLPEVKGAYPSLLKNAVYIGKEIMKVDLGEFETQVYNYPVIKAYQRFGMEMVKARYSFQNGLILKNKGRNK